MGDEVVLFIFTLLPLLVFFVCLIKKMYIYKKNKEVDEKRRKTIKIVKNFKSSKIS